MVGPDPPQKCRTTRMAGRAATVVGTYSNIRTPPGLFPKLVTSCSDEVSAEAGDAVAIMPATTSAIVPSRATSVALAFIDFSLLPSGYGRSAPRCWCFVGQAEEPDGHGGHAADRQGVAPP